MALVALEGMRFYAGHGYYEEEQTIGNQFVVDVYVKTSFALAAVTDELEGTVNYETIYQLCKLEMKKPSRLLEAVAQRIVERLREQFPAASGFKVRVAKCHPPLGGRVDRAYVEVTAGSF